MVKMAYNNVPRNIKQNIAHHLVCVTGTAQCDKQCLRVHTFRISNHDVQCHDRACTVQHSTVATQSGPLLFPNMVNACTSLLNYCFGMELTQKQVVENLMIREIRRRHGKVCDEPTSITKFQYQIYKPQCKCWKDKANMRSILPKGKYLIKLSMEIYVKIRTDLFIFAKINFVGLALDKTTAVH